MLNILFIVTTHQFDEDQIILFENIAKVHCFQTNIIKLYDLNNLNQLFDGCFLKYTHIFIAGHGDEEGTLIGDDDKHYFWTDLIPIINNSGCICKNTLLYIQGCFSNNASNYILNNSKLITQIIGYNSELKNIESYISFLNFLYYTTHLELSPSNAVDMIKNTISENIVYTTGVKI